MKCLIIAAGRGNRLQEKGESKPLIPLLGIPLIERVIRTALNAGANDFYVVTGFREENVRNFLVNLAEKLNVPITTVFNKEWEKQNGLSVLKAEKYLSEPFLLLMSDHIFDPDIARNLITLPLNNSEIVLAVDRDIKNPLVDMEDVTRVITEGGKIRNIGKGLDEYNGFDTGIFYCTPAIFDAIRKSSIENDDTSLSGAGRIFAGSGSFKMLEIDGRFWIDVDDPASFAQAENALLTNLQNKPNDGST